LPEEWDSSAKHATSSSANNEGQRPPSGRGVTEDCSKAIEVDEESSSHCKDKINGLHS
jgi:hypothetical protein